IRDLVYRVVANVDQNRARIVQHGRPESVQRAFLSGWHKSQYAERRNRQRCPDCNPPYEPVRRESRMAPGHPKGVKPARLPGRRLRRRFRQAGRNFSTTLEDCPKRAARDADKNGLVRCRLVVEGKPLSKFANPQPDNRIVIRIVVRATIKDGCPNVSLLECVCAARKGLRNDELEQPLDLFAGSERDALQDGRKCFHHLSRTRAVGFLGSSWWLVFFWRECHDEVPRESGCVKRFSVRCVPYCTHPVR